MQTRGKCKRSWTSAGVSPPGGTHIFGQTGMCRSNGLLFYKKSLNMGPIFYQQILKHGSTFLTEPKFLGFRMAKNPKNHEIFEKWAYFSREILKNVYPFLPKSPLKMGRGFDAQAAHPCPTQIWVTPRGQSTFCLGYFSQLEGVHPIQSCCVLSSNWLLLSNANNLPLHLLVIFHVRIPQVCLSSNTNVSVAIY